MSNLDINNKQLFSEIKKLIEESRSVVAQTINSTLTATYWNIGKKINDEILQNERAEYGKQIVSTLWRQLSWSHFKEIIYLKTELEREFYSQMCRIENWSVRTLRKKIDSMLFERTAISKKSIRQK